MPFPAFDNPWHSDLRPAMDYDFTTELSPGVWKVYRRADKAEYLAHDISDQLYTDPDQPWNSQNPRTDLCRLMDPDFPDGFMGVLRRLLHHENLVSLRDVILVRRTNFGGPYSRERWYTLWDFCDAGNLGNLLVPDPNNPPPSDNTVKTKHLPEAFCWHVLTSMLRALAWLHDGTYKLEWNDKLQRYVEMGPRDPYWQPIFHRNITPTNIFFRHPKRGESYGLCKLGNFGAAYVTGYNPVSADFDTDAVQKIPAPQGPRARFNIVPAQGVEPKDLPHLETLRENDWKYQDSHPPFEDQPYTLVSEYRALGEVIQAMMVPPASEDHIRTIRSRPWWVNLARADYSEHLRRFVQYLMEMSLYELAARMEVEAGHVRTSSSINGGGPLVANTTSALYARALRRYEEFRRRDRTGEARHLVTVWDACRREQAEDAWRLRSNQQVDARLHQIVDEQDKRFGDPPVDYNGNPKSQSRSHSHSHSHSRAGSGNQTAATS